MNTAVRSVATTLMSGVRCARVCRGWRAEDIPASPRWTERSPERAAERAKLEAKRAEAPRKLEHGDD